MCYTLKDLSDLIDCGYSTTNYRVLSGALPAPNLTLGRRRGYDEVAKEAFIRAYKERHAAKDLARRARNFG